MKRKKKIRNTGGKMAESFRVKRTVGWVWVILGLLIVLMIALEAYNIYTGNKPLPAVIKVGADAGLVQMPPTLLNMILWALFSLVMAAIGTRLWNFGFAMIKESKE